MISSTNDRYNDLNKRTFMINKINILHKVSINLLLLQNQLTTFSGHNYRQDIYIIMLP